MHRGAQANESKERSHRGRAKQVDFGDIGVGGESGSNVREIFK